MSAEDRDDRSLQDAGRLMDLVCAHACTGKLDESALARLVEIDDIAPPSCRFEGGRLWRAVVVDRGTAQDLAACKTVEIPVHPFSCWSRSPLGLMNLARLRFTQMQLDASLVIIAMTVGPEANAIDIASIFHEMGSCDNPSWVRYGAREQEVVLHHDTDHLTVHADMVAEIWGVDDISCMAPRVGEGFFAEDEEHLITSVGDLENGGWLVEAGLRTFLVHWDFGDLSGVEWHADAGVPAP